MDYAKQQRDPTKHAIGLAFVVLMHVLVIYALFTGLGKQMFQIIKKPMSATIIEEIKPPPPPPPPPPKKIETPPPPPPKIETFVPPPDVPVVTQSAGPTITVVQPEPPPPKPVVVEAPPPPPPKPAVRKGIVRLSGDDPVYPRQAIRAGVEKGLVLARVTIDEKGNVTDVIIVSSQPPKVFDQAVIDALKEWKFKAEGEKYVGEIEVAFKLQ